MRVRETPLSIANLSDVAWSYAQLTVEPSRRGRLIEVLAVSMSGPMGIGSAGRRDAAVLYSAVVMGWHLWRCDALLIDMTGLDYVWGDDLLGVLEIGDDPALGATPVPVALVCANANRGAIEGLVDGIGAGPPPYLTTDRATALSWIERSLRSA